jgi:hypothetical protein
VKPEFPLPVALKLLESSSNDTPPALKSVTVLFENVAPPWELAKITIPWAVGAITVLFESRVFWSESTWMPGNNELITVFPLSQRLCSLVGSLFHTLS